MAAPFHGFAFWFDVEFSGPAIFPNNNQSQSPPDDVASSDISSPRSNIRKKRKNLDEALVLSTAPEDAPTHWQQVCISVTYIVFQMLEKTSLELSLRIK